MRRPQRMPRWIESFGRRDSRTLQIIARGARSPGLVSMISSWKHQATLLWILSICTTIYSYWLSWVMWNGREQRTMSPALGIWWTELASLVLVYLPFSPGKFPCLSSAPDVRRQTTKLLSMRSTLCLLFEIWTIGLLDYVPLYGLLPHFQMLLQYLQRLQAFLLFVYLIPFVRIFLDKLPDKSGGCWGWKAEEGGRWWQLKAREGQHPSQKDDHCLMVKATCLREWLLVVKRFNNSSLSVAKNPDGDISATKELPEICWCPKN